MVITEYADAKDLLAMEALYQIIAAKALELRVFLSREQFLRMPYTVSTTCDGLLAIVKRGLPLNLIMQAPSRPNGIAPRR